MRKQRILPILLLSSVLCILSSTAFAHHNLPNDKGKGNFRFTETNPLWLQFVLLPNLNLLPMF